MGSNDHLHEERGFVPQNKMGPGYEDPTGYKDEQPLTVDQLIEIGVHYFPTVNADAVRAEMARSQMIGIGGAPTRATTLPTDPAARKQYPIASGVLDYFPDAIAALAHLSWVGNEKHNPGQPLHWARGKSSDEADTMLRHFLQRGTIDDDGVPHSVKVAWRALAILQKEIENGR